MASQNPFLANWLKGAYGMELGLAPMLEQQAAQVGDDPELRKNLTMHLEQTRRHASLLRERLQGMGEDLSTVRPTDPVTTTLGRPNGSNPSGGSPDTSRQTELLDYVTESFEVASYRSLQSVADMLGDRETSSVCEQILADEVTASEMLARRLPGHNGHNGHNAAQAPAAERIEARAREVFAALDAHDLGRFDKLVTPDYRAEMPGATRPSNWAEYRAWMDKFFKALPDLHYQVNRIATTGDTAFVEWNAKGTHAGPFPLPDRGSVPATHKIDFEGVSILRFQNDKIVESRIVSDTGKLMRQLSMTPGAQHAAGTSASTAPSARVGREIVHIEIPALDRQAAARFYNELFGWEYEHMDDESNYTMFQSGTLPGGFPDVSEMNPVGEMIFYVYSDDIESDLRRAEQLGGQTVVPRTEIPGYGYFAILTDPTGNRFGLYYVD